MDKGNVFCLLVGFVGFVGLGFFSTGVLVRKFNFINTL